MFAKIKCSCAISFHSKSQSLINITHTYYYYYYYYELNEVFILFVHISEKFEIYANVRTTRSGFPRIYFNGHSYGHKKSRSTSLTSRMHWKCTRLCYSTRKRCLASIITKVINGYTMMRINNPIHTCDQ